MTSTNQLCISIYVFECVDVGNPFLQPRIWYHDSRHAGIQVSYMPVSGIVAGAHCHEIQRQYPT